MSLQKRLLAEFIGTTGLLIVVVGSGIMGETLSNGNVGIALLANSIATGAGIFALIQCFKSISGAHFNPIVSFVEWIRKKINAGDFFCYSCAQILGGLTGVLITHLMFGQNILQLSTRDRGDVRFLLSEFIASIGLILVMSLSGKRNLETTPVAVSFYILSAYWCTSSTSFANPAVTIARSVTNTFSGILWTGSPWFIIVQFGGAVVAVWIIKVLSAPDRIKI